MPRLYARDALVHALVPRLVGLAHDRLRTISREHPGDLPVVLLTGRHGMGRTAVLDALAASYEDRIPCARTDLAVLGRASARDAAVSNSSAVAEVLVRWFTGLAPSVPPFGPGRFPRLLAGLFAVTSWHRGNDAEQQVARARIAGLLAAAEEDRRPGPAEPHARSRAWMSDVAAQLTDTDRADDLEPVADAVVRQFFARHARGREARTVQQWYLEQDPGADDGPHALVRLCRRFHRGGDYRRAVERLLMTAFLTDLADFHDSRKRLAKVPRALVLLDDVHTEAGRDVLDLLLDHRAGPGQRRPDPLVVVATALDDGSRRHPDAVHRGLHELVDRSGWSRTVSGSPSAGLLTVELPPLDREDLLAMLDDAAASLDADLPTALHRLTGGRPLACRLLCDAVLHASADERVEAEDLLRLRTADGRPVTERLLERLVPDAQLRDLLVLLSVARTGEAAQALSEGYAGHGPVPLPAAAAARFLREELWQPGTERERERERERGSGRDAETADGGGAFVADPFLRAVLVEELRRTSGDEARGGGAPGDEVFGDGPYAGAGRRWTDVHAVLRDHHAALGEDGEPDVLRHTLAAGDTWAVVLRLCTHFGAWEADRWLDCLRRVVTAPHPPSGPDWHRRCAATARGARDREHEGASDLHRCVNRLLHGAWYLAETLGTPPDDLCRDLEKELDFLSLRHPTGHAALSLAAREWPAAAREQRPFPP